jgi:GT2 family glycosyltransferase
MNNQASVAAVVVTYNRLPLLKEVITALRQQQRPLQAIYVINNSSTDGSEEWLRDQSDLTVITQPNKGGALGFYTGLKSGYEAGHDWVWCMDDDGVPAPDALAQLLQYEHRAPCVINALVVRNDDPAHLVFKTGSFLRVADISTDVIENGACFFNGTLFHREVIQRVGLPLKDLSIWGDETEYYHRILFRGKLPVFTVVAARHSHPAQSGVFYKKEWDARNDWKTFFYIRNKAFDYQTLSDGNRTRMRWMYVRFLAGFLATIFLFQKKDRLQKIKVWRSAAKDGWSLDASKDIAAVRAHMQQL